MRRLVVTVLAVLVLLSAAQPARSGNGWESRAATAMASAATNALRGEIEEAIAGYDRAIRLASDEDGGDARQVRFGAWMAIGALERTRFRYRSAMEAFARAEAVAGDSAARLDALVANATLAAFLEPGMALAAVERAFAQAASLQDAGQLHGQLLDLRGRALLNAGRAHEALATFHESVERLGGLQTSPDRVQFAARGDGAIAAAVAGSVPGAYRYLSYAGASHRSGLQHLAGRPNRVPVCGEDGVRMDDVAVMEFTLGDNGKVANALPIYLSRAGVHAAAFVRAVSAWSWPPEQVQKVHPFLRANARAELRCTEKPPTLSPVQPLLDRAHRWLADRGVQPRWLTTPSPLDRTNYRVRLEEIPPEAALARAPLLMAVALDPSGNLVERHAAGVAVGTVFEGHAAPPVVAAFAAFFELWALTRHPDGRVKSLDMDHSRAEALVNGTVLDPEGKSVLKLLLAEAYRRSAQPKLARTLVDSVLSDPAVDGYVRLAAQLGNAVTPHSREDRTHPVDISAVASAEEICCLLFGSDPLKSSDIGIGRVAYPTEAREWRTEGWADVEFAVDADGAVLRTRTLVAVPPLAFGSAAEARVADGRHVPATVEPTGPGCHLYRVPVVFKLSMAQSY